MKSPRLRTFAAALTLGLMTLSAAPAATPRSAVTVGDFAVKLTRSLGYAVDDEATAADTLRRAGVHVDPDLSAPLTESRAGDMLRELGVDSTSSGDPSSAMSPLAADRAANMAALQLGQQAEGFSPSPETEACQNVDDRTSCYQCCFAVLSAKVKYPIAVILICGVLCVRLYPPASPSSAR